VFDLNILSLYSLDDHEQPELPGLYAANAPHRAARGRTGDQIILLLTPAKSSPIPAHEWKSLAARLAQTYFETAGSVTAALRATADQLNQSFLEKNLRSAADKQRTGVLNLAVLHSGHLYLANAGPTQGILVSGADVNEAAEVTSDAKKLGLSRALPMRYYEFDVKSGDELILCAEPPAAWNATGLSGCVSLTLDQLRHRLLHNRPADVTAGVVQFLSGSGKINFVAGPSGLPSVEHEQTTEEEIPASSAPVKPSYNPVPSVEEVHFEPVAPAFTSPAPKPAVHQPKPITHLPEAARRSVVQSQQPAAASRPVQQPERSPQRPEAKAPAHPNTDQIRPTVARWVQAIHSFRVQASQGIKSFFGKLVPAPSASSEELSPLTMAFIAVAVPIVVVIIAYVVYNQRGNMRQYQQYFLQAQNSARAAQLNNDTKTSRSEWSQTINWLDDAERFKVTDESQALRTQAQNTIDNLDGIVRLDFQPAIIGGLSPTVRVSRMISSDTDLYMLDASKGRVIRATLTNKGYEVDSTFRCEPGQYGSTSIGSIVDIAPLPKGNNYKAAVIGLDKNANLVYCIPDDAPLSVALATPDTGWGKIEKITYDTNNLYVLDPKANAVWIYSGSSGSFSDRPQLFFDKTTPPMADVIDLAVNSTDLFLLHADGHMTLCTLSLVSTSPTRCTDPTPFTDARQGADSSALMISDTHFSQILFTQPPDPSIYLLDTDAAAIYHFSLRLNLQRQLRAQTQSTADVPTANPTAFTISATHTAFIAFANQVFYGQLP
jgi:hypothetical protein